MSRIDVELTRLIDEYNAKKVEPESPSPCPICESGEVIKNGRRYNKHSVKQKYICKTCGTCFINPGYFKQKFPLQVRHYAIILYRKGYSLASVQREIKKNFKLSISRTAIWHWLQKAKVKLHDKHVKTVGKTKREIITTSILVAVYHTDHPEKLLLLDNDVFFNEKIKVST